MRMTSRRNILIAGVGVLAFFVGAIYIAMTASKGLPGQQHRFVRAQFTDVGGLRAGDDVRVASVRVGQVSDIRPDGDHALVTLQLSPHQQVYRDAAVAIQSRSALGQNFVELNSGTPSRGELPADVDITGDHATGPASLDQVLSTFDPATRAALAGTVQQVGGGLLGHGEDLHGAILNAPDLLKDLGTVSRAASAPGTDLDGLLRSTTSLAERFQGRQAQVADLTKELGETLDAVATDHGEALSSTVAQAPDTLAKARAAMVDLKKPLDDLNAGMASLRTGSAALGDSTPDLRATLRDAVQPLGKVTSVARQAEPAVSSLTSLMADARPLAPRLQTLLGSSHEPAAVLAPYAPEISRFFTYWDSANGSSDKSGHYLRIDLVVRPESIDGVVPVRDPLVHRNPYPAPGQASNDRASTLLGGN